MIMCMFSVLWSVYRSYGDIAANVVVIHFTKESTAVRHTPEAVPGVNLTGKYSRHIRNVVL